MSCSPSAFFSSFITSLSCARLSLSAVLKSANRTNPTFSPRLQARSAFRSRKALRASCSSASTTEMTASTLPLSGIFSKFRRGTQRAGKKAAQARMTRYSAGATDVNRTMKNAAADKAGEGINTAAVTANTAQRKNTAPANKAAALPVVRSSASFSLMTARSNTPSKSALPKCSPVFSAYCRHFSATTRSATP